MQNNLVGVFLWSNWVVWIFFIQTVKKSGEYSLIFLLNGRRDEIIAPRQPTKLLIIFVLLIIFGGFFSLADLFNCFADQLAVIPVSLRYFTAIGLLWALDRNGLYRLAPVINIDNSFIQCGGIPGSLIVLVHGIAGNGADNRTDTCSKQGALSISSNGLAQKGT